MSTAPTPLTRIGMAPRRAGMTYEAFQEHWRTSHADVVSRLPGLRGYTQNHAVLRNGRPLLPYPGFDACSELLFDSVETMDAAFSSEVFRTSVQDDERAFVDKTRFMWLVASRETVKDGPVSPTDVKLMTLWRPAPGVEPEALDAALDRIARQRADRVGLVRHHVLRELPGAHDGRPPACRRIDIEVFASADAALADLDTDDAHAAARDLAGIAQAVGRHLATEVVVVPPR